MGNRRDGDVVLKGFASEVVTDDSLGEGHMPNAAPDPPPSGGDVPMQNGVDMMIDSGPAWGQQPWNWHYADDWLDEHGVATGPADWLDEDGVATAPEGWFRASAIAAAGQSHDEIMPLETILTDTLEDCKQHNDGWTMQGVAGIIDPGLAGGGQQQAWIWERVDYDVATSPTDWLTEDGIATAPDGWFFARAVAATLSLNGGMPLETIMEETLEDYEEDEDIEVAVNSAATNMSTERGNSAGQQQDGVGLPGFVTEFDQQDSIDTSVPVSGSNHHGGLDAVVAFFGRLARVLKLDVIRNLICRREAGRGCVCLSVLRVSCSREYMPVQAKYVYSHGWFRLSHCRNDSC